MLANVPNIPHTSATSLPSGSARNAAQIDSAPPNASVMPAFTRMSGNDATTKNAPAAASAGDHAGGRAGPPSSSPAAAVRFAAARFAPPGFIFAAHSAVTGKTSPHDLQMAAVSALSAPHLSHFFMSSSAAHYTIIRRSNSV